MNETKLVKAYSYIRMSSEKQLKGDSLERQVEKTKKYADEHGWILDDSLRDLGVSAFKGKNVEDGALGRFIELCESGEITRGSILIVENLDRMSRQRPIDAFNVFTRILKLGIEIVVLDDGRHFTEDNMDMGNLFISIGGMVRAHAESERKSDLISSAWRRKQKNGSEKILTRRCPAWLTVTEDKSKFVVDPEKVETIKRIFDMCIDGHGLSQICTTLNKENVPTLAGRGTWHISNLRDLLRQPTVLGTYVPHTTVSGKRIPTGEVVENYFPQVIDDATFHKAQAAIDARARLGKGRKGVTFANLFQGLVRCGVCGGPMHFRSDRRKKDKPKLYLRCYNSLRGECDRKTHYDYQTIEDAVLATLDDLSVEDLAAPKKKRLNSLVHDIEQFQGKLKTVTNRRQKLIVQFADTNDNDVLSVLDDLADQQTRLKALIAEKTELLAQDQLPHSRIEKSVHNIETMIRLCSNATDVEITNLRTLIASELKNLLDHVTIHEHGMVTMYAKNTKTEYAVKFGLRPGHEDDDIAEVFKQFR